MLCSQLSWRCSVVVVVIIICHLASIHALYRCSHGKAQLQGIPQLVEHHGANDHLLAVNQQSEGLLRLPVEREQHQALGAERLAGKAVQLAVGGAVRMRHIDALEDLLAQGGHVDQVTPQAAQLALMLVHAPQLGPLLAMTALSDLDGTHELAHRRLQLQPRDARTGHELQVDGMRRVVEVHAQHAAGRLLSLQRGDRSKLVQLHARRQRCLSQTNGRDLLVATILELQLDGAHAGGVEVRGAGEAVAQLQAMAAHLVEQLLVLELDVRGPDQLHPVAGMLRLQRRRLAGQHGGACGGTIMSIECKAWDVCITHPASGILLARASSQDQ